MKRSTRVRIAKFNRFSTSVRMTLFGVCRRAWYEVSRPEQMAAARELIRRDLEASTLYA